MTLEEVKSYLRVDFDDDDALIRQMMAAAEAYIIDAVGKYDNTNPKANLLFYALVQDLYDNRSLLVTDQQRKRMSYTYGAIILQLQYQAERSE